ncbi:MAG: hypothetical protein JW725_02380 [Candidatus Babeliaceae bacterium]|nr:hypothetical protein [Candidatus Babeliaceae bacterium]
MKKEIISSIAAICILLGSISSASAMEKTGLTPKNIQTINAVGIIPSFKNATTGSKLLKTSLISGITLSIVAGLSIGASYLYDKLTPEQKKTIVGTICNGAAVPATQIRIWWAKKQFEALSNTLRKEIEASQNNPNYRTEEANAIPKLKEILDKELDLLFKIYGNGDTDLTIGQVDAYTKKIVACMNEIALIKCLFQTANLEEIEKELNGHRNSLACAFDDLFKNTNIEKIDKPKDINIKNWVVAINVNKYGEEIHSSEEEKEKFAKEIENKLFN